MKPAFLGTTKRSGTEPRKLCKLDEAVPKRNTVDEGSSYLQNGGIFGISSKAADPGF